MRVLLIPGHGEGDSGAVKNGVKEEDLTRELAALLQKKMIARGMQTDVYNLQKSMCKYLRAGNSYNFGPYDYVAEIHFDSADTPEDGKTTGSGIFVHKTEKIRTAEENILRELENLGFRNRGIRDDKDSLVVMNACKVKQRISYALIEVCFLSDPDDLNLYRLKKEEVADAIARGIAKGYGITAGETAAQTASDERIYKMPAEEIERIGYFYGANNGNEDIRDAYKRLTGEMEREPALLSNAELFEFGSRTAVSDVVCNRF